MKMIIWEDALCDDDEYDNDDCDDGDDNVDCKDDGGDGGDDIDDDDDDSDVVSHIYAYGKKYFTFHYCLGGRDF